MDTDNQLLEKWCNEWEVPYSFTVKLKGIFFPLLDGAHTRIGAELDRAFLEQNEGTEIRHDNSKRIMDLLKGKLNPGSFSSRENWAISLHLEYMTLVEGFLAPEINFLVLVINQNGHQFEISKEIFAKTMRDIEKASFSKKFEFIGKHGFKELSKRKHEILMLRNSAAHRFYQIDPQGCIIIGAKKTTEEGYAKLYDYLRNVAISLYLIKRIYYKRFEAVPKVKLKKVKCVCGYTNLIPAVEMPKNCSLRCTFCGRILSI